ncbi:MAG: hypothetical protein EBR91_11875, partial [Flavobacteriia bacterium]|nr:hypothetical protein [Flavobacteriia bacterium]
ARDVISPTIGAFQIGSGQGGYSFNNISISDQNNVVSQVFDTTSTLTITAFIYRGNISQSTQYSTTLFQDNVPIAIEIFQGNPQLSCDIDTLVFQTNPILSSGSVTFKVMVDSINGNKLDSIPFTIQSNTLAVGIRQKAQINKSVNSFYSLPISLNANTPEPGNSGVWRRISIVPGTLNDSTLPSATFTGSRGSFHRVSYTISNNVASHTDTFEFYIANCPSGFASDSLILCDSVTTLLPGASNSYAWSTGDTTSTLRVNQSGWYSVVLNSDSCVLTDSIYVQLKGKLQNQYVLDTLETCPGLGLNLWGTNYSPIVSQMGNASNRFQYLADTGHFQKVFI